VTPADGTRFTVLTASAIGTQHASLVLPNGVNGALVYDATSVSVVIGGAASDTIFEDGFDGDAP
jgi:hypothetical protein